MNIMSPSQRKELRLELAVLLQQAMLLGGDFSNSGSAAQLLNPCARDSEQILEL